MYTRPKEVFISLWSGSHKHETIICGEDGAIVDGNVTYSPSVDVIIPLNIISLSATGATKKKKKKKKLYLYYVHRVRR